MRAVQGHHNELTRKYTEQAILTNLYSFDEEFTAAKYLAGQYPRAVRHPELTDLWRRGFPAVLYHTCDLRSAESILKFGLVPGGYPKSTGRAHVYFNPTPPWEAQMRKLAGTRAGRPVTIAFDTELMMQDGIRLFTSDEAFMSADWVGNAYIIYAFHTRKNEFLYFNRAYPELRKRYREALTTELAPGPQDVNPNFVRSENTLTAEKAWRHWRTVVEGTRNGKQPRSRRSTSSLPGRGSRMTDLQARHTRLRLQPFGGCRTL